MSPRPRRARAAGLILASLLVLPFTACRRTPTDGFQLVVPSGVASKVAWYEIGIFSGPECGSLGPQLSGGVPPDGYVQRLAFPANDPEPPGIPDLPRATYAIGVAARASDCSVVATGCTNADLSSASSVTVQMSTVSAPQGACTDGATCDDARCTSGAGNASSGAGCSLVLLGAGPFADPLDVNGTLVGAPAVAATGAGFLIGYREYDPSGGQARFTVIPIDESGGAGPAQQTPQNACLGSPTNDAVALLFSGSSGLVAAARAPCGGSAGIDFVPVDPAATLGADAFADLGPAPVTLSTGHALAASSTATYLAYTQAGLAQVATLAGTTPGTPTAFGPGGATDAWISATDDVVALLAAGSGTDPSGLDDGGAGDDGGDDGGSAPVESGAPPGTSTLSLDVVPVAGAGSAPLAAIGPAVVFPGTWGSISAQAGRVFVASDGTSADKPIAYRAFDVGTSSPSIVDGFTTPGAGAVAYADVAFHQDHAFFAAMRPGSITLVAFDHATTTPTLLRQVSLDSDPRVPSLATVRDGGLVVIATDSRVVVAWATAKALSPNDAVGGYAVFACTTP
jgi:hypothetical protein